MTSRNDRAIKSQLLRRRPAAMKQTASYLLFPTHDGATRSQRGFLTDVSGCHTHGANQDVLLRLMMPATINMAIGSVAGSGTLTMLRESEESD